MINFILSKLLQFGLKPLVDSTLDFMTERAKLKNDRERIRADVEIEHIRAAVADLQTMAKLQEAKYRVPWFWLFAGMFVAPLALWWLAVILDSIFLFSWSVAALPAPLDEWAGQIIAWLFFVGGGVALVKGR